MKPPNINCNEKDFYSETSSSLMKNYEALETKSSIEWKCETRLYAADTFNKIYSTLRNNHGCVKKCGRCLLPVCHIRISFLLLTLRGKATNFDILFIFLHFSI
jgi:hypothetical protein